MIWDKFAKDMERLGNSKTVDPLWKTILEDLQGTKVFLLDDTSLKDEDEIAAILDEVHDDKESFRLPFETIAVCLPDSDHLVLLHDLKKDSFGFEVERGFITYLAFGPGEGKPNDVTAVLSCGRFQYSVETEIKIGVTIDKAVAYYGDNSITDKLLEPPLKEETMQEVSAYVSTKKRLYQDAVIGVGAGMVTMWEFSTPNKFVMEMTPKKVRKNSKGKLVRSHERPLYTIAKPKQLRQMMRIKNPEATGAKKLPHERRGHYRTLRHDRYGDRRGKRIWIKATWVGDSSAQVGNKFYKVLL